MECWRFKAGTRYTLVKLELTDPSALTLYWGSSEITTPDGTTWETGLLKAGPISFQANDFETNVVMHTCPFTFADRRHSPMTSGTLLDTLASHRWHGASVTVYRWHSAMAGNPEQVYKGQIFEFETGRERVLVRTMQRQDWNRRLPIAEVTRAAFPRAGESMIGRPAGGIAYGDLRGPGARPPAPRFGYFYGGNGSGNGYRYAGIRGAVVTRGRGSGGEKSRVLFTHHPCALFEDESQSALAMYDVGGMLCDMDPLGHDTFNS